MLFRSFLSVLSLRFCARAFSSCGKRGHSSSRCAGLSLSRPLPLWSTGSRRAGSVVVAHGPSCSAACGILPDQGSNPCPLHWQADSQPLRHQGSPPYHCFLISFSVYVFYCFFKASRRGRASQLARQNLIKCNDRSDIPTSLPYSFGETQVTCPTQTQGEGITQRYKYQEAGIMGATLKSAT